VAIKQNGTWNMMLDKPALRTTMAGSIAEIETLRTTLLIEIADVAVNGG